MALTTGQNETDFASIEKEPFLPTLIVFQSQTQGSLCNVSKSQTHVGSDRRGLPVNLCLKKCDSYLKIVVELCINCPCKTSQLKKEHFVLQYTILTMMTAVEYSC